MTDVLVLRDVRRTFRGSNGDPGILRSVRLHLRKGEIVALVGPSGSGKSSPPRDDRPDAARRIDETCGGRGRDRRS